MAKCKQCKSKINVGDLMFCPNCGAEMCSGCAMQTLKICPYCYYDLEING